MQIRFGNHTLSPLELSEAFAKAARKTRSNPRHINERLSNPRRLSATTSLHDSWLSSLTRAVRQVHDEQRRMGDDILEIKRALKLDA